MAAVEDPLTAGRRAISRNAWKEAFELLEEADRETRLEPDTLEDLASAAWWSGDLDACIGARERAYAGHLQAGEPRRAAVVAIALVKDCFAKRSSEIGAAWLKRAQRLLDGEPECAELGALTRVLGVIAFEGARDYDEAIALARRTREIGERSGDRDLQALGLHDEARALIAKGEVAEGRPLMDEATLAAVSGELAPMTTGVIYCNTIASCEQLADYARAGEWTEAARRWCERQSISGFPGLCRVHRASIMRLRGAWREAEQEAWRASQELRTFNLGAAGEAFYEIGEIRLNMGDLTGAEGAFDQAHELGREPHPGISLLHLARGRPDAAASCIRRALEDESDPHRPHLLSTAVEVALAVSDLEWARTLVAELDSVAQRFGTAALEAGAAGARAALELAEGHAAAAVPLARRSWRLWQDVDAPFEAAKARVTLAQAYRANADEESATLELKAARATFERLGAAPDARAAAALLGEREQPASEHAAVPTALMFTDIVDSTPLVEAIGDEAWGDVLRWHDETLRSLFVRHGGEEANHTGDGFFVAFQDVPSAVECAVAVQRRLAEHRRAHGFAPQVRIGLHAAPATRSGSTYRGKGVHEAARIAALAGGGEILVSRRSLSDGYVDFPLSEPRSATLKGVSEALDVLAVDWRSG